LTFASVPLDDYNGTAAVCPAGLSRVKET